VTRLRKRMLEETSASQLLCQGPTARPFRRNGWMFIRRRSRVPLGQILLYSL